MSLIAVTQHGVRLALAEEDNNDIAKDNHTPIHDDMSPSMLIAGGLYLEDLQYVEFI